jgi:hypothetical protein
MLTVKDFIGYNNPCFFCKTPIDLKIRSTNASNDRSISIKPDLSSEILDLALKVTYVGTLNLKINHTHNRFNSNNFKDLTAYLKDYKLSMSLRCNKCGTTIKSKNLQFDLVNQIIKPLEISSEVLNVIGKGTFYSLVSNFQKNISILSATPMQLGKNNYTTILDLPLQPLSKFDSPEHFIKKMKTLLLFI